MASIYPEKNRSAWILAQRPAKQTLRDPEQPHGVFLEEERLASGELAASGVILTTNKECPWRCLMCDLWKDMLDAPVPRGAIPRQIDLALSQWRILGVSPKQVKLYNSGSFFDPQAIPLDDYAAIAHRLDFAANVVVESHPALIGENTLRLRDRLSGSLEVAMGLETSHPEVLEKLNKKFDLKDFAEAANFLKINGIALRVFVLIKPPFMRETEGVEWAVKSADFAFTHGASVVSLIPTRAGNGAMDRLQAAGEFGPPTLESVEAAFDSALALGKRRVFVDTWGLTSRAAQDGSVVARVERLQRMNISQELLPRIEAHRSNRAE